jgi:hypothetical protein
MAAFKYARVDLVLVAGYSLIIGCSCENENLSMNVDTLRDLLRRAPFEPFELITSAGERHLVKHPEFAILLPSRIVVTHPAADRVVVISLIHLTEARFISSTAHTN